MTARSLYERLLATMAGRARTPAEESTPSGDAAWTVATSTRAVLACVLAGSLASCARTASDASDTRSAPRPVTATASSPPHPDVATASTDELAREYRALRTVAGHMQRVHGPWNSDVDSAAGRKGRVMAELGRRLAPPIRRARILEVLGAPDREIHDVVGDAGLVEGQRHFLPLTDARTTELLCYEWRGSHDFLYVELRGEDVVKVAWWMAGE